MGFIFSPNLTIFLLRCLAKRKTRKLHFFTEILYVALSKDAQNTLKFVRSQMNHSTQRLYVLTFCLLVASWLFFVEPG